MVPDVACPEATGSCPEPPDAGAERWCQALSPPALFCADFDGVPFSAGWNNPPFETAGGINEADPSLSRSPPNSYRARTPPLEAGTPAAHARLCNTFEAFPTEMHLAFDVQAVAPDGSYSIVIASLRLDGDGTYYMDIVARPQGWQLAPSWLSPDAGLQPEPSTDFASSPDAAAWTRVEVDVTLGPDGGATAGTIQVRLGGVSVLEPHDFSTSLVDGKCTLCIGAVFADGPNGAWDLHFDNVAFDMLPTP